MKTKKISKLDQNTIKEMAEKMNYGPNNADHVKNDTRA